MLNKQNLIKYFENGIKSNANLKIGTEHEKFILNKDTFLPLKYDEENGINNIFLREFAFTFMVSVFFILIRLVIFRF